MADMTEDEENQSLWSNILSQVQESSITKLPSNKVLLVLGDDESGKTSLIARLQGIEDPKKGSALEYHYIAVKDDYRDDVTRLGVWILDGNPWHRNLLKFVLSEETFPHCTVLLTGSMAQPWDLLESLNNWASLLEEHIGRLKLGQDKFEKCQMEVLRRFQDYSEPGDEIDALAKKTTSPLIEEAGALIPLGENTLTSNLGLDIIVVITKTDSMSNLEKDHDYKDEHFDFIQQAIRKFCLRYGTSLFYTSVKENKNIDLLSKYLVHRIFNFPFKNSALVVEKDSVFIPSGWDNDKKIAILYENLTSVLPDDHYSEVIIKPLTRKPLQREAEVLAEQDQSFLARQLAFLSQQQTTPTRQESPSRNPPQSVAKSDRNRSKGPTGIQTTPKNAPDGLKPNSEGVLQNFFNSLLSRKTTTPSPGGGGIATTPLRGDKPTGRTDVAAELDRMMKGNKRTLTLDESSSTSTTSQENLNQTNNES